MASSRELLVVKGLRKVFHNGNESKTVFQDIGFSLASHDSLAVVGPSGCGKTTLLLIVAGLIPPTSGSVLVDNEPVASPMRKIALVLQDYGLFPWKTVAANIAVGARLQRIRITDDDLAEVKRELGIEGLDRLYPRQLSGGQRQRVALARAILLRPSLLLLDEPFAAIDTLTRERLQGRLAEIFGNRKFSFIIVTHNIEEAVFLGRRILVFGEQPGGVRAIIDNPEMGTADYRTTKTFFDRTMVVREYLGESQ